MRATQLFEWMLNSAAVLIIETVVLRPVAIKQPLHTLTADCSAEVERASHSFCLSLCIRLSGDRRPADRLPGPGILAAVVRKETRLHGTWGAGNWHAEQLLREC